MTQDLVAAPFLKVRESHDGGRHSVTCEGCLVGRCVSFRVAPGLYGNKSEPLPESAKENSGASPAARDAGKGVQFASPDERIDTLVRDYAPRPRKPSGQLAAPDKNGIGGGLPTACSPLFPTPTRTLTTRTTHLAGHADPRTTRLYDRRRRKVTRLRVVFVCARGKARIFSGCNSRPATRSLQPVAIGAAVEVTKPPEPSMQRVASATPRAGRP